VKVYEWIPHGASVFVSVSFLLGIPGNLLVVLVHVTFQGPDIHILDEILYCHL